MFKKILTLSDALRPGYENSLGDGFSEAEISSRIRSIVKEVVQVPDFFLDIYTHVSGTRRDVADQRFMDLLPGYRLIHLEEFSDAFDVASKFAPTDAIFLPFLANYSSDFIGVSISSSEENGFIGNLAHDDAEFVPMHKSSVDFFLTLIAAYERGVYFTDSDGYLDFDFDLDGEVGAEFNPGISYWIQ